jgi:anti-sigma regulatory factor (Ser/Thr protein kinase)
VSRTAVETARFTRVFHGQPDQVSRARHEVARHLSACGCPVTDDVTLIVSEFAANAVLHSGSRDQFFTVRTELFPTYVRVEVEDLGGPWNLKPRDPDRPHGLDVVEALTGPDNWGVDGDETGRVAWCRLELAAQR